MAAPMPEQPPLLERIIAHAIRLRWVVMTLVAVCAVVGVWSFQRLPIDATPDITNVQVQINTEAPGFSPLETEQRVTFPVETAIAGLPGLQYTRSLSRYGLSQVTVVFKDGTDLYFARQLVGERLQAVRDQLPAGLAPELGPISTGLGEIFMNRPAFLVTTSVQLTSEEFAPEATRAAGLSVFLWKKAEKRRYSLA